MPALRNFVEREGLQDSFRLLGAVSLERVARLHNAADIFLLPSLIEGIALALFEAMALESVPVVADVGGQRELVPPDCGYLIPLEEADHELAAYVAVLKHLLENPERRRQMGCACRARVRDHFRLSQMTTTFLATMQQAGLRHRSRPARLPDAAVCRELATLAIDHIRLTKEALILADLCDLMRERTAKQEKIIAKLHRQAGSARSANFALEENAVPG